MNKFDCILRNLIHIFQVTVKVYNVGDKLTFFNPEGISVNILDVKFITEQENETVTIGPIKIMACKKPGGSTK